MSAPLHINNLQKREIFLLRVLHENTFSPGRAEIIRFIEERLVSTGKQSF